MIPVILFHRIEIENIKQIFLQNALIKKHFVLRKYSIKPIDGKVLFMQSTFDCIRQVHVEY